jgi:phosphoserine phosphatase
MTHVATLIAKPGALDATGIERARALLRNSRTAQWLAPGTAADIPFEAADHADLRVIADELRTSGVDVVVQPAIYRRKKLFLADMDSTMIGQECIDELADYAGLKPHIAAITERAMRGEIAFEPALRERVALLKGLPSKLVAEIIKTRITLTPGGRTLLATMRKHGAWTCLVSGGFTLFVDRIAAMIGFDETRGNVLTLGPDGHLNGLVAEPIFGRDQKRATLIEIRDRLGLTREQTMATGDGANDLGMIAEAGLGVAYHAKPAVAAAAQARIEHGNLTALLYAQGYRRDEFVDA